MSAEPHLEIVQVRDDQSCKLWPHEHPCWTVRWHLHPEYELHPATDAIGRMHVGDHIGPFGIDDRVELLAADTCYARGFDNLSNFNKASPGNPGNAAVPLPCPPSQRHAFAAAAA